MPIKVYYSSVTGSREVKMRQAEVIRILDVNQIKYELVDVAVSEKLLEEMREKARNSSAIPPQIFNEDIYCGDFELLYEAAENYDLLKFLKMPKNEKTETKNTIEISVSGL
ncbi:SH3 domain-binding glutamic acid-rich-like protein 3 [Discoglossus pictus]